MPYDFEEKAVQRLKEIRPNLTFEFADDQYSPFDVLALNEKGQEHALFELKNRTPEKCKYVRRDKSLLVDQQKVDSLAKLSKEKGIPSILVQVLEDTGELTTIRVADKDGNVNPKLQQKTITANANTFWGGDKAPKGMFFYNLDDTHTFK